MVLKTREAQFGSQGPGDLTGKFNPKSVLKHTGDLIDSYQMVKGNGNLDLSFSYRQNLSQLPDLFSSCRIFAVCMLGRSLKKEFLLLGPFFFLGSLLARNQPFRDKSRNPWIFVKDGIQTSLSKMVNREQSEPAPWW